MSHDKKHDKMKDKFEHESQDARRRDEHNTVHPDDKSAKNHHKDFHGKTTHSTPDKKK